MSGLDGAITMVSKAAALLAQAKDVPEWREVQRVAGAAKAYLRGRDEAHSAWLHAGEIELRAKKRLADFVARQPKHNGRPRKPSPCEGFSDCEAEPLRLEDLGVPNKGKAHQEFRQLADVPAEVFEERLAETIAADRMPSVASVVSVSARDDYDGDSWCTPKAWIDRAREVMGGIDLDPATNPHGQKNVRATTFYTAADNGLTKPWHGRVWLNPPYSTALMQAFAERVLVHDFEQCIVLVNNCTDAGWWHTLSAAAQLLAFTRGRIAFEHPKTGEPFATRQGQTFFYFGARSEAFAEVFARDGACAVLGRLA